MPTRKETRSIADFVADVAYRKRRAAEARFAGTSPDSEMTREVFLAACASIGTHLSESYGFQYAKSGPHAKKRSGDFTFQIGFQSSHHNIAGEHVDICVHASVLSARIKKWRKEHLPHPRPNDYVAGGQLGNLQTNHCWLNWELADAGSRDETIRDVINGIEQLAFPYFAAFEDLPSLLPLLASDDVPEMRINRVIEFLMCFADQPTARMAAANFLKRQPGLVQSYQREYELYAEQGLDQHYQQGWAKQLAFASIAFKFGNLTEAKRTTDLASIE